jgi:hypothetical protein
MVIPAVKVNLAFGEHWGHRKAAKTKHYNNINSISIKNIMYRLIPISFLLLLVGCLGESRPDGMPDLIPCSLQIIQEGQPLPACSVSLYPLESSNPWSSGGTADENGRVHLRTHGRYNGIPAGKYKVTVWKQKTEGELLTEPINGSSEEMATYQRRLKENPQRIYHLVAPSFLNADTTPLEINVEKGGKNSFTLDVGKAVHREEKPLP